MRRWGRVLALWALALGGCRSYSSEALDEVYREALHWEGRDDASAARQPSAAVWKDVETRRGITLADAYRIALTQSERIARAAESYIQSLTVQDQGLAALLPTVSVQGTQFFQEPVSSSGSSVVTTTSSNRQGAVLLSQPLFHGLRELAARKAAKYSTEAVKSAFDTEKRVLFQIVAQAFLNTLFFERQQKILEDAVKNSADRLREMRARQQQGIARKTEVLLIETQVASDEAGLNRGKQSLDLARIQMAFLLGRPLTLPLLDDLVEPPPPADFLPLLQRAMTDRSDLKQRQAELLAAEQQIDVVTGEHYPTLDFNGDYYFYRENYAPFQKAINWDALFTVTFNLFKGGDVTARTAAAESQWRVARLTRDELVRQIETDINTALFTWRSDRELITTLETRERTSQENYTQVVTEYRQGIAGVSNLEVLVAQNQHLSAQLELERARMQSKLDWFQLENAQGRIPVR